MDVRDIKERASRCFEHFASIPRLVEDGSRLKLWQGYFGELEASQISQSELHLVCALLDQLLAELVNVSEAPSLSANDSHRDLALTAQTVSMSNDPPLAQDNEQANPSFDGSEDAHAVSSSDTDHDSLWGSPDATDEVAAPMNLISEIVRQLLHLCPAPSIFSEDAETWSRGDTLVVPDALLEALQAQDAAHTNEAEQAVNQDQVSMLPPAQQGEPSSAEPTYLEAILTERRVAESAGSDAIPPDQTASVRRRTEGDKILEQLEAISAICGKSRFRASGVNKAHEDEDFITLQLQIVWSRICRWAVTVLSTNLVYGATAVDSSAKKNAVTKKAVKLMGVLRTVLEHLEIKATLHSVVPEGPFLSVTDRVVRIVSEDCTKMHKSAFLAIGRVSTASWIHSKTWPSCLLVDSETLETSVTRLREVTDDLLYVDPSISQDQLQSEAARMMDRVIMDMHEHHEVGFAPKPHLMTRRLKQASQELDRHLYNALQLETQPVTPVKQPKGSPGVQQGYNFGQGPKHPCVRCALADTTCTWVGRSCVMCDRAGNLCQRPGQRVHDQEKGVASSQLVARARMLRPGQKPRVTRPPALIEEESDV